MSKDYFLFESESGETAYMAGVVDVLSDNLTMHCKFGNALEADIFYIKDNDMSLLNEAVKKRLHTYNEKEGHNISIEKIDKIDLQLREGKPEDYNEMLYGVLESWCQKDNLSEGVKEFLRSLQWYLGKPTGIYSPVKMPDKNIDVLGKIYLYMAWDYFFIAYNDYLVLIIIGTVE